MAIGSDGEIGVVFARWGDMDEASRQAWYRFMRTEWHANLMAGYATICQPKRPFIDPDPFPEEPYLDD